MNKSIKRQVESFLWYSGLVWMFEKINPRLGHIIELHRVGEFGAKLQANKNLSVTTDYLEKTILFFKRKKYEFISLDDLVYSNYKKNRFVIFTLDDGYVDNLYSALPIFEKYNVPFTIFICTGFPDNTAILWWYIIEDILLNNENIEFDFKNKRYKFEIKSLSDKEKTFRILHNLCLSSNKKDMTNLTQVFFDKYSKNHRTMLKKIALSWEQIINLSDHPMVTIGSHGEDHYPLSTLSMTEINSELCESKKRIESRISKKIIHFSYPYGIIPNIDSNNFEIFKKYGYESAVTTKSSNISCKNKNPYLLPRISLNNKMKIMDIRLITSNITPFLQKIFIKLIK